MFHWGDRTEPLKISGWHTKTKSHNWIPGILLYSRRAENNVNVRVKGIASWYTLVYYFTFNVTVIRPPSHTSNQTFPVSQKPKLTLLDSNWSTQIYVRVKYTLPLTTRTLHLTFRQQLSRQVGGWTARYDGNLLQFTQNVISWPLYRVSCDTIHLYGN